MRSIAAAASRPPHEDGIAEQTAGAVDVEPVERRAAVEALAVHGPNRRRAGPGRPASVAERELAEQTIPAAAGALDARRVLVDRAEGRVPRRSQEIVRVRRRAPPDPDRAEPLLAVVARLGQRPHRGTARAIDVVDELLMGSQAQVLVGRVRIDDERPAPDERQQTDAAQDRAGEPGAARDDDDRAATPLQRAALRQKQQRARDDEHAGDNVERRRPADGRGVRVAGDRQRPERRGVGEAEHQQVFLRVVHHHVERQWRAGPVVVREHLDAGDDQDPRVGGARARDALQITLDPAREHRALLAGRAGERAKRQQAVLDAQQIVLGDEERANPLLFGQRGELLQREVARGEIGVDVKHRRKTLERDGRARDAGDEERQQQDAPHASRFSRTSPSYTASIFRSATGVENSSALATAASPSFRRRPMSRPSRTNAAASAATSSGSTRSPDSPSVTTAGIPPTAVAPTGSPSAIDSTRTRPMPSLREGMATASAATRHDATSAVSPSSRRRWVTPSDSALAASASRSGPSPTSTTRVEGIPARIAGSARTSRSN